MRNLASIQKIVDIQPIIGADQIVLATVLGWKCIVKKDEFNINDLCIYIEIDSWVPNKIASFLSKGKEPKEYKGIKGERLKTIKMRKCYSQGLILKIDNIFKIIEKNGEKYINIDKDD